VSPVSGDVQNENALAAVLAGHDVVIHTVKFLSTNASKIIAATKAAKVPRLLVVVIRIMTCCFPKGSVTRCFLWETQRATPGLKNRMFCRERWH
jgi:NAD(P)H-binding